MKVLVIDDEPDVRFVARVSLSRVGGMTVIEASSGAEGVERARDEQPDFILLDLMMPDMDGVSTFRALAAQQGTASIPVIFLTANTVHPSAEVVEELGAKGVLRKPFDAMTLADQVKDMLRA